MYRLVNESKKYDHPQGNCITMKYIYNWKLERWPISEKIDVFS